MAISSWVVTGRRPGWPRLVPLLAPAGAGTTYDRPQDHPHNPHAGNPARGGAAAATGRRARPILVRLLQWGGCPFHGRQADGGDGPGCVLLVQDRFARCRV